MKGQISPEALVWKVELVEWQISPEALLREVVEFQISPEALEPRASR